MTAKRLGLIVGLVALASWARAQGMASLEVQPVFQSEGFDPIPFSVSCPTSTWTVVVASDTISRSTFLESITANANTICLLPFQLGVVPTVAVSSSCVTAAKGIELTPASSYTDYTHVGWACISSGTVTNVIKGVRTRDSGDYGMISAPEFQNR